MIHWTKSLLDRVEDSYRTSSTPNEGLARVRNYIPKATYSSIRRALSRYNRPSIQTLLGSKKHSVKPKIAVEYPVGIKKHYSPARLEKILLISDVHAPYCDETAFNLVLDVGMQLKPDIVVIMGDFADYYSISKYSKNPNRILDFKTENNLVKAARAKVDQIPAKRKIFLKGNHEQRLVTHLAEVSPALYNFSSVDEALELSKNGWKVVDYHDHARIGKLFVTHDAEDSGRNAHQKTGATFEHSIAIGHVHSLHISYFGNALGESHVCASLGWLGDYRFADYAPTIKKLKNWQLGFGFAYHETDTGNVHLQAVPIIQGKCVVEGILFK